MRNLTLERLIWKKKRRVRQRKIKRSVQLAKDSETDATTTMVSVAIAETTKDRLLLRLLHHSLPQTLQTS